MSYDCITIAYYSYVCMIRWCMRLMTTWLTAYTTSSNDRRKQLAIKVSREANEWDTQVQAPTTPMVLPSRKPLMPFTACRPHVHWGAIVRPHLSVRLAAALAVGMGQEFSPHISHCNTSWLGTTSIDGYWWWLDAASATETLLRMVPTMMSAGGVKAISWAALELDHGRCSQNGRETNHLGSTTYCTLWDPESIG